MNLNKEQYKAREEEIRRKCYEIYQPPGFVVTKETAVNRESKIKDDIKFGVPNDSIFKRRKPD